tara:strand:+ start:87 stop:533 length:447 start_codon:yes stop_codon:yes gene_type:complete
MAFKLRSQPGSPFNQRYPERKELYPGEDAYFKANPKVGGMAAEDNKVIINPYSPLNDDQKNGVRLNETSRLWMRNSDESERPNMRLRRSQKKAFNTMQNGESYSQNPQDIRETIIARVISGDASAGKTTRKQRKYAEKLKSKIESDTL